ncbi:hypothetical protein BH24CHL5_BH24CHL5_05400 [soil metagenome]
MTPCWVANQMSERSATSAHDQEPALSGLIAHGALDAELGALLWLLAEHGLPLVVASTAPRAAEGLRGAVAVMLPAERRSSDGPLAGGALVGRSLEDVLRLTGGGLEGDVSDDARDLGIVVVADDLGRVTAAHYVRPVERDGAGHLQRRPPGLLSARDPDSGRLDHFHWGITDELAMRAGLERDEFEDAHASRARLLSELAAAGVHDRRSARRHVEAASLAAADPPDLPDTRH